MKRFIVSCCLLASVCFAGNQTPLRISDGAKTSLLTVQQYQYTVKEKELEFHAARRRVMPLVMERFSPFQNRLHVLRRGDNDLVVLL